MTSRKKGVYLLTFSKFRDPYELINEKFFSHNQTISEFVVDTQTISLKQEKVNDVKNKFSINTELSFKGLKYFPLMINQDTDAVLTNKNVKCWWHRDFFTTKPLGIPLKHIHCQNISLEEKEEIKQKIISVTDEAFDIEKIEYFLTEGWICSFSCLVAYIIDHMNKNSEDSLYKDSLMLTNIMYYKYTGSSSNIPVALDWKLLDYNGGQMTYAEWSRSIENYTIVETNNFKVQTIQKNRIYKMINSSHIK